MCVTRLARLSVGATCLAVLAAIAIALANCHKLPLWSGSIEVTPIEREAIEACGSGELTSAGGRHLSRSPYVQSVTQSGGSIAFAAWPDPAYHVEVTTPEGEVVASAKAAFAGLPERRDELLAARERQQSAEAIPPRDYYVQRADLSGLEPGTVYCYQLIGPGGPHTERAPLATAPAPGSEDPIELVVLGDSGSGNAAQKAIAQRLEEHPFELMIFLGDIAYTDGTPAELEAHFFEIYDPFLRFVPAYAVLGNHEYRTADGRYFVRDFVLPGNERYYSFDWGDVHFVALDTNRITGEQAAWLERDLAASDSRWTVAFGHHPPYSNAWRGPNRRFRRILAPILERHGVDLVLSGHEHHYERFAPRGNTHYLVSGGGGGRLTKVGSGPSTVARAAVHHFLAITIDAERITVRAIDIEGRVFDELAIEKPAR